MSVKPTDAISQKEVMRLVNRYVGVEAGNLGNFSYRTHRQFYPRARAGGLHPAPRHAAGMHGRRPMNPTNRGVLPNL